MQEHTLSPRARRRHWTLRGLTPRQEKVFHYIAGSIIVLMIGAWITSIVELRSEERRNEQALLEAAAKKNVPQPGPLPAPPTPTRNLSSEMLDPGSNSTAFINEAALALFNPLRGYSGQVKAAFRTPGQQIGTPGAPAVQLQGDQGKLISSTIVAPSDPGIYKLAIQMKQATQAIRDLSLVTLVPFAQKKQGRIGLYYLGRWPFEGGGTPKTSAYANPNGFIEVNPQNANTFVSSHFRLRDFLTKDQPNVWPKYLLLNPKLLDKLELTIQELQAMGHPVKRMQVMSGFRTPNYNVSGGNMQGRANLSRHMYGDASDVFVDNDGNGVMDDLNGDGRVDVRDAEVILAAADRVERKYPALVGGVGVYSACCGHGPFTHIDVRGYRARWRGFGNG
jgi:uncharacterized protein YcbK (DUF882 family)